MLGISQGPNAIDHFSGGWLSDNNANANNNFMWFNHITGNFEYASLAFYDTAGYPIWAAAYNDPGGNPLTAGQSGYCGYAVTNAWYPDEAMPAGRAVQINWLGSCDGTPGSGWNIQRSYGPQLPVVEQPGEMALQIHVPASVRGTPRSLAYGSSSNPGTIAKWMSNHDVRFLIDGQINPTQCQAEADGGCLLRLTYFSDGTHPYKLASYGDISLLEVSDTVIPVDANADGLTDFVTIDTRACLNSACEVKLQINSGRKPGNNPLNLALVQFTLSEARARFARVLDYNGDGLPDLLVPSNANSDSARWHVHAFRRELHGGVGGFSPEPDVTFGPLAGDLQPEDPEDHPDEAPEANSVFLDHTGDGLTDQLLIRKINGCWRIESAKGDHNSPGCGSAASGTRSLG